MKLLLLLCYRPVPSELANVVVFVFVDDVDDFMVALPFCWMMWIVACAVLTFLINCF